MQDTNTFQIIFLVAFGLAALIGVVLFATGFISGGSDDQPEISFSIWGEFSNGEFDALLDQSGIADIDAITISYTNVPSGDLEERLINALARGAGPDVLLTPHTNLLRFDDLIATIGEDAYSTRQFRDAFAEGAEIFLQPDGIKALPLAVDPLVMYWNRDILTEAGFVSPPEQWNDVPRYTRQIVQFDDQGGMETGGVAMGTVNNIPYVKEILSTLFHQAGNSILSIADNGGFRAQLDDNGLSLQSAVNQYSQYASPSSDAYAWNNSFSSARQAFASGSLGFYLAPASDIRAIRNQNPNLNFDVAIMPQLEAGSTRTHGVFYGFSILQRAPNKLGILNVLQRLASTDMAEAISIQTDFAPVRKDVLSTGADDAYRQIFYDSAVISRGWYEPDPDVARRVFEGIITDVASGRRSVSGALQSANTTLQNTASSITD